METLDVRIPAPTVFEALRDFWWVLVFTALLGAGIATAYGVNREPTYTAESRMSVGRIDVSTQAISGFVQSALKLADSYSRAIDARSVIQDTAQRSGLPQRAVDERVSASPVPESLIVRVFAEDSNEDEAVRLANTASRSLVEYVRELNKFNPESRELLNRYHRASEKHSEALAQRASQGPSPRTQADVDSTRLELQTAGDLYRSSQAGQASPNTLQILALAATASSDSNSALQRALFVGVIGGLLIGAGLALFLAYRY